MTAIKQKKSADEFRERRIEDEVRERGKRERERERERDVLSILKNRKLCWKRHSRKVVRPID
jgi:hypothetical protein